MKLRPLGEITLELEPMLEEMIDTHGLQADEVAALVWSWIQAHRPESVPQYVVDDTRAVLYVGHIGGLK